MDVLIVSTSLGGGHNVAANRLAKRLQDAGHSADIVDVLDLYPHHGGSFMRKYYSAQLRFAPWTYQKAYDRYSKLRPAFAKSNAFWTRPRIVPLVNHYDIAISNNPHATMALGNLVASGEVVKPVINMITDFVAHHLWVHPALSANLVFHEITAQLTSELGGHDVVVIEALVDANAQDCRETTGPRHQPGTGAEPERRVLVSGGAWGVGSLKKTICELSAIPNVKSVVVCGNNQKLQTALRKFPNCEPLGWTNNMSEVFADCDAFVCNAGGMTTLEALVARLPVVFHRPIPGHGVAGAHLLRAARLAQESNNASELRVALVNAFASQVPPWPGGAKIVETIEAFASSE